MFYSDTYSIPNRPEKVNPSEQKKFPIGNPVLHGYAEWYFLNNLLRVIVIRYV